MPKFLEAELKKRYGANSDVPYKIMNSIGAMHGNKETEKGREMEAKHDSDGKPMFTRHLIGRKGKQGGTPAYVQRGGHGTKYGSKS